MCVGGVGRELGLEGSGLQSRIRHWPAPRLLPDTLRGSFSPLSNRRTFLVLRDSPKSIGVRDPGQGLAYAQWLLHV